VKRLLLLFAAVALAAGAIYLLVVRDTTVEANVAVPRATAAIGTGAEAVGVGPDGAILDWQPAPEDGTLPELPLAVPPDRPRLAGPVLQQARVLGGAPAALRPYLAGSLYGESGVDVELRSGIELRFGDASRLHDKWSAAAAVLADPSITALDYVDLYVPGHAAVGGSSHALPAAP
jgi:hypothetical protein